MRLSLIGMSGSGKSYWTKKFAKHGFGTFHCDDLIKGKLSDQLIQTDGTMLSVGEWMGFPFDTGYRRREMRYLAHRCHRLVWLNPRLGSPSYQPLVQGMSAALPFVDDFLPIHNLESLQALADHLVALPDRRPVRSAPPVSDPIAVTGGRES